MTTEQLIQNWSVPEELPTGGRRMVGRILQAGAINPPKRLSDKSGNTGLHFTVVVEPLNFRYEGGRDEGFEDDYEHITVAMFNRFDPGQFVRADEPFGLLKAAFQKLGFPITGPQDTDNLVGKVFIFENTPWTYNKKVKNEDGSDKLGPDNRPVYEKSNPIYFFLPIDRGDDNYVHQGSIPTYSRSRKTNSAPNVASQADNEAEALPVLAEVLDGKAEGEYFMAIAASKNPVINRAPYITEAQMPATLTSRMLASGRMRQVEGKLVKV